MTNFGKPQEFDARLLPAIRQAIVGKPLVSWAGVAEWIKEATNANYAFAPLSIRRFCYSLNFKLPLCRKDDAATKSKPMQRDPQWTKKQIAELNRCGFAPAERIRAVLLAGIEPGFKINQIATECGVSSRTLYLDILRFQKGGIKGLARLGRRRSILERTGTWFPFTQWCDAQFKLSGKCPGAEAARRYLMNEHELKLPTRAIYNHLNKWRSDARIPIPKRKSRKVFDSNLGGYVYLSRL